jgi:ClpP class serine protease
LEAHRFSGKDSLEVGIIDTVGGLDEVLGLIRDRKLLNKATTGIYGYIKEDIYARVLDSLDNYARNLAWREKVEEKKDAI